MDCWSIAKKTHSALTQTTTPPSHTSNWPSTLFSANLILPVLLTPPLQFYLPWKASAHNIFIAFSACSLSSAPNLPMPLYLFFASLSPSQTILTFSLHFTQLSQFHLLSCIHRISQYLSSSDSFPSWPCAFLATAIIFALVDSFPANVEYLSEILIHSKFICIIFQFFIWFLSSIKFCNTSIHYLYWDLTGIVLPYLSRVASVLYHHA